MAAAKPYTLVVEGDPHNLIAVSSLLRELKVPFKRNTTGDGVVDQLHHMSPRPEVVLMSLDLPEGNAYDIAAAMRADPDFARVRLVAIGPDHPAADQLEGAGFDGFIATPLPRRQFSSLLKRVMAGEHIYSSTAI
jgi:CheY-like chemotaxis protein